MGDLEVRRPAAWRFVRAVVRAQRLASSGAVLSGLLWQTGAVAAPLVVKYAIDNGIVPRDHHALLVWLFVLLAVGLLEVCAGALRHIYAIRNRSHSDAGVRDALFAHALRLDATYHDRVGPGELLSRASSDSQHIARMMDAIGHTIGYVLTVVAVAIVMLILDWRLALVVLIPLPFVTVGAWLYSRKYDKGTRELQDSWAGGVDARRGDRQRHPRRQGARRRRRAVRPLPEPQRRDHGPRARARAPGRGLHPGARDAAAARDRRRALDRRPQRDHRRSHRGLVRGVQCLRRDARLAAARARPARDDAPEGARRERRITEVLEAEPQLREPRHPVELDRRPGDVRLDDVRFGHEGDRPMLDGLDLHVAPGESLALVGATGSGKSTVAGLLARLYDPEEGRVLLDGHDLRELRLADVRRAVALVFEETFLFSESVRENIRFGRPDADDEDVAPRSRAGRRGGVH